MCKAIRLDMFNQGSVYLWIMLYEIQIQLYGFSSVYGDVMPHNLL